MIHFGQAVFLMNSRASIFIKICMSRFRHVSRCYNGVFFQTCAKQFLRRTIFSRHMKPGMTFQRVAVPEMTVCVTFGASASVLRFATFAIALNMKSFPLSQRPLCANC